MREILFRGKRTDNGEWVEGFYLFTKENTHPVIIDTECCSHIVVPETVGQYTGQDDRNGRKIFEGDIFKGKFSNYVFWFEESETTFVYGSSYKGEYKIQPFRQTLREIELIGNIYDNPDLMLRNGKTNE